MAWAKHISVVKQGASTQLHFAGAPRAAAGSSGISLDPFTEVAAFKRSGTLQQTQHTGSVERIQGALSLAAGALQAMHHPVLGTPGREAMVVVEGGGQIRALHFIIMSM